MSLQEAIAAYHVQRFPEALIEHVALKLGEEAGETASAVNGHVSGGDYGKGDVVGEAADAVFVALALVGGGEADEDPLSLLALRVVRQPVTVTGRSPQDRSPAHRLDLSSEPWAACEAARSYAEPRHGLDARNVDAEQRSRLDGRSVQKRRSHDLSLPSRARICLDVLAYRWKL